MSCRGAVRLPAFPACILVTALALACSDSQSSRTRSDGAGGSSGTAAGGAPTGSGASAGLASGGTSGAGGATRGTGGISGASGSVAAGGDAGSAGAGGVSGGAGSGGTGGDGASGAAGSAGTAGQAGFTCPPGPFPSNPVPQGAVVTQVTAVPPNDGFIPSGSHNVEGPVWIGDSLYMSHIREGVENPPPGRILKLTDTTVTVFAQETMGSNGLAVTPDGRLLAARHADGSISEVDLENPANPPRPIAAQFSDLRFNSPNDLAVRSDGNIYFSDPSWQATSPPPQAATRVYRVDTAGTVSVIDETLNQPNGVTLSLDEVTLFVSGSSGVFRYPVDATGSVGSGMMMQTGIGGADGMVMDCAGNLYVTTNRDVVVLSPAGSEVTRITVMTGPDSVTNVAFGGPERKRLFVTGRGNGAGLWYVDVDVPGLPY